jgi:A/G-specific adenine glycosylase
MLQQTRVETVIPYFERWMERFPTLADLAAASEQAVLQAWEGLGYYSRARNLHRAAQLVMEQYSGELPHTRQQLEKLPGIGRYTAGAIASIAFGQDEAALDGNIRRVIARLYDIAVPARSPEGERLLWARVEENLPAGRAGDFNQALMDLGSEICTPRNPSCLICPEQELCLARQNGTQEQRPVLPARRETPHYTVTAAVIERAGMVLLARRPAEGLLGGMWEFPGGKQEPGETLEACLRREIEEELGASVQVGAPFGMYEHAYTHFSVTLHAFLCRLNGEEPQALHPDEIRWVRPEELPQYPMGKIDRQIARRLLRQSSGQQGQSNGEDDA